MRVARQLPVVGLILACNGPSGRIIVSQCFEHSLLHLHGSRSCERNGQNFLWPLNARQQMQIAFHQQCGFAGTRWCLNDKGLINRQRALALGLIRRVVWHGHAGSSVVRRFSSTRHSGFRWQWRQAFALGATWALPAAISSAAASS